MRYNSLWFVLWSLFCVVALCAACDCGDDDDDSGDDDAADDDVADDDVSDDDAADDDVTDDDTGDDDTTDDDTVDDDTADDDTVDDDTADDDATPPTDPISVYVFDLVTGDYISDVTCELISPLDGSSFDPAVTTTSDGNGLCAFNQTAKGLFSIKFTQAGYVTSYGFNYPSESSWYFGLVTPADRALLALSLGVTLDSSKGVVSGGVMWIDETNHNVEPVGCAVVTNDNANTIYYFNDARIPVTGLTETNADNGYFLAVNVPAGSDVFYADVEGDQVSSDLPIVFADSIVFVDLYYLSGTYPTNPTPGGCE